MTFRSTHLYANKPDSSVPGAFNTNLPLTVVAQIITFLNDDVASLARLCRTSRVLWYMTLPYLWKQVTLKSYSTIRYRDDVPEGFGSASPFSIGLNALVTRNVANMVRSLSLGGEYSATDMDECARAGRVSESSMILNIAIRAAVDQCLGLERFQWDLNTRIQPTVYTGLLKLPRLESLWLRFPASRCPQPAYEIPPCPNLKSFTMTHYDPLCYPDDISTLLQYASKLAHLTMHFSPRMREQGEPSVSLAQFFRKNIASKKSFKLKTFNLYNLLNSSDASEFIDVVDSKTVESCTMLNTLGVDEDAPLTAVFSGHVGAAHIDRAWPMHVKSEAHQPSPKAIRMDQLHTRHANAIGKLAGLEKLYLVNARYGTPSAVNGKPINGNGTTDSPATTTRSGGSSPYGRDDIHSTRSIPPSTALRDLYLDSICDGCGPTLRHLILPSRWPLTTSMIARIIRTCPNLTQLAVAIECLAAPQAEVLRLLVPFLADLWAIRLLAPTAHGEEGRKAREAHERFVSMPDHAHEEKLGKSLVAPVANGNTSDFAKLKYVGIGWKSWEVGGMIEDPACGGTQASNNPDCRDGPLAGDSKTKVTYRRKVTRIEEKDVQHVEIWKMDSLEIV